MISELSNPKFPRPTPSLIPFAVRLVFAKCFAAHVRYLLIALASAFTRIFDVVKCMYKLVILTADTSRDFVTC